MSQALLKIDDLSVSFATPRGNLKAVRNVSLELEPGQSLGVVGESGSGKTVLSRATMGLIPGTATRTGQVWFQGQELLSMDKDWRIYLDISNSIVSSVRPGCIQRDPVTGGRREL